MPAAGTPGVKRVADSRGHATAPPARSDAPAPSSNTVKSSNAVKPNPAASNNPAVKPSTAVRTNPVVKTGTAASSNPGVKPKVAASNNPAVKTNSAAKTSPAVKKSAPTAPVGDGTPGGNGTAVRSGASVKSDPAAASAAQSSNPIQRRTTGQSGTPSQNGNHVKSDTPVEKFEDVEKVAVQAFLALKAKNKKEYNNKTQCDKAKCKRSNGQWAGRFLQEREHIEHQELFKLAQAAPKGAHLHIHLNACLEPAFLLELAASDELKHNMYISVDLQNPQKVQKMRDIRNADKLKDEAAKKKAKENKQPEPPATPPKPNEDYPEPLTDANIGKAKFQFHFLKHDWDRTCSLFDPKYCGRVEATDKPETYHVMKFTDFLRVFHTKITHPPKPNEPKEKGYQGHLPKLCMDWLIHKLVFQENEVKFTEVKEETAKQTEPAAIARQWDLFNARTQMMKGLFMAQHAYEKYLDGLFSSFDKDKIQYAELRPNFMAANSVIHTSESYGEKLTKNAAWPKNHAYDPTKLMDNKQIMKMIIEAFKKWKKANPNATFKSMKVIMCTPRARGYKIEWIEKTMQECLDMKRDPYYKPWIAGFDFVGPEFEGRTLQELGPQFKKFGKAYKDAGLKWILHCGESIYDKPTTVGDKLLQGNLKWALDNLDPHRLAHGYAIKNAKLSEANMAKLQKKCCIESCPSSNEILGLAYNARYAVVHWLKSKGIACSVSCDNPTLFNATLSHEFYQVTVGDDNFGLMEWKELMMDSIEHSVWNDDKDDKIKAMVLAEWEAEYKKFVYMIRDKYAYLLKEKP